MASSEAPRPGMSRRFAWLATGVVLAIGLYTAGWYYVSGELLSRVDDVLQRARSGGNMADCTNPSARGYPFRIGLFCDTAGFSRADGALSVTATGLRSAAQVYQPSRVVGEIDAISIDAATPEGPVAAVLRDVRLSGRLARRLPERASATATGLELAHAGADIAAASAGQAHMRTRDAAVDLAASLSGVQLAALPGGGTPLPPFDVSADLALPDGVAILGGAKRSLRGIAAEIRSVRIHNADIELLAAGTAAVDAEGLVDATLTIDVKGAGPLLAAVAAARPDLKPQIDRFSPMVAALGATPRLPLSIRKGVVSMGFFRLGTLPALD